MTPTSITDLPLRELGHRLRTGMVAPGALIRKALAAARTPPHVRAFVWLDDAAALERSQKFSPETAGPLGGLPVSVKDLFDMAGQPTTCGSPFFAGTRPVPAVDSGYVARWRRAGVTFIGKTLLNEFAYGITGENRCFGDCVHPAFPNRLTGGSSSGAAASVAMGAAVVALGTDTGGSLRVPAALCGLVSFRGSHGLGETDGSFPLAHSFDTLGWLQKHLGDVSLVGHAVHPEIAPASISAPPGIGIVRGSWCDVMDLDVAGGLEQFAAALRGAGAPVNDVPGQGWEQALEIFAPMQAREAFQAHARFLETHGGAYDPAVRARLEMGRAVSEARYDDLAVQRAAFATRVNALLDEHEFLVAPASALRRLETGVDHAPSRARLLRLTAPASLARLPVLTVPWPSDGEPGIGFQVMTRHGNDARLWAMADWLATSLRLP
jgi:Asp-tRNA(Asn)/Glu-tRNA(Gln) amidotransferase A subunit family amidase